MSIILKLQTQQVDYGNSLYQTLFDQTVFVELPEGFEIPNQVLFIQQYVYGLSQNQLYFYRHLGQGLNISGFAKSDHDD